MNKLKEIFLLYRKDYLNKYRPNKMQYKFLNDITKCKSKENGYHLYTCNTCKKNIYAYNSCLNRHCPVCSKYKEELWKQKRYEELLNTKYIHLVLGVPRNLYKIFYYNQEVCYNILFKSANITLNKINNGMIGSIMMLHTWSQKLNYHPHLHIIMPKGKINILNKWDNNINLDLNIIEKVFKKTVIDLLKKETLNIYNNYNLKNSKDFKWLIYKKDVLDSKNVIDYFSKYTFKVGLTEDKIISNKNNIIIFKYKDWKNRNKERTFTYTSVDFIRRYLMHILPKNFVKIRYYGFLSTKNKKDKLNKLRIITNTTYNQNKFIDKIKLLNKMNNKDVTKCRYCNGILILKKIIYRENSPNNYYSSN